MGLALGARLHLPHLGEDLGPPPDLDGRRQVGELGHHHLAAVESLGVMRPGVTTTGEAHDDDSVLEGLHHYVARAGAVLELLGLIHRCPLPLPFPFAWARGRTVSRRVTRRAKDASKSA